MDPTFWELLFVLALTGALFVVMPRLTRPDVFFAVTVAPAFRQTSEGRRVVTNYRLGSLASSLLALAVLGLTAHSELSAPWMALALLPQVLGTTVAFVTARRHVLPHAVQPATTREAVVACRRETIPGGWALQVLPFMLLTAAAVILAMRWPDLPARIPVHWGLDGQADRWTERTLVSVFAPMAAAGLMCGLMLAVSVGLLHGRRVRATGGTALREARFRRLTMLVLFAAETMIALGASQVALFVIVPPVLLARSFPVLVGAGLAATIVLVVLLVRLGQGGSSGQVDSAAAAPVGDRTPDSAWKWGLLYVNTQDPAMLVEKRFGVGYTFNFGHPIAWLLLALLVGVPVVLALFAG
jgi:uncharacterized membrane protein